MPGTPSSSRSAGLVAPAWVGTADSGLLDVGQGAGNAIGILAYNPVAFTVTQIGFRVGVQAGNMILGVYDAAGARLYQEASFAVPASGAQRRTLTASFSLPAGPFYIFVQGNNAALSFAMSAGTAAGAAFFFANIFTNGMPANLPALTETDDLMALTAIA